MNARRYHEGGYIAGPEMVAWIHPEECILRPDDDGAWRCIRPEHAHDGEP